MAARTLAERTAVLAEVGLTPLLTHAQVEAYFGVSDWTVKQWVNRGCPHEEVPIRGKRFDLDRVKAWIAETAEADEDAATA